MFGHEVRGQQHHTRIFDLGLKESTFPGFLIPQQFSWKPYFTLNHSSGGNVFWIDSGIVTFGSIEIVFQHIEQNGYFLMDDPDWRIFYIDT